ncbi:glycosyltransferase family 2 protein [Pseudomonadota bacterium]
MISVIIPTRNRADFLAIALHSIARQDLPQDQFEVLVIDNGSTDRTRQVVGEAERQLPNLSYFFEPEPGLHAGRHRGLREANAENLVYADDDIRAAPSWLSAIAENFADPQVAMVGGNNYPDFLGPVPAWLEILWNGPTKGGQMIGQLSVLSMPLGKRKFDPMFIWGCNFSIRKQVLLEAGGFHPDAMPKDLIRYRGDGETHVSRYVRTNKLGCVFDSRASVYHAVLPERMTFGYFRQRSYNQGISDSYTSLRCARNEAHLAVRSRQFIAKALGWPRKLATLAGNSAELRELMRTIDNGYREGFEYHQTRYREDSEIRAWVHQPDYL